MVSCLLEMELKAPQSHHFHQALGCWGRRMWKSQPDFCMSLCWPISSKALKGPDVKSKSHDVQAQVLESLKKEQTMIRAYFKSKIILLFVMFGFFFKKKGTPEGLSSVPRAPGVLSSSPVLSSTGKRSMSSLSQ